MNKNFENGFEKTALLGLATKLVRKAVPKIFKKFTHKAGKFSAGKATGSGLTGAFVMSDAANVVSKTNRDVNRRVMANTLR